MCKLTNVSGQAIQFAGYNYSEAERLTAILQETHEMWLTLVGRSERDGLIAAVTPASRGRFACSMSAWQLRRVHFRPERRLPL